MGMEKYAKTIIPTIEANYERYTETERHIADYFLKNDAIGDLSAEFISTELSVSPASLSRFAKKSGYQGYREFVYEYRNSYVEKTTVEQEESRLVLDTYQSLLNKVYNLLDEAQIKRIVENSGWQNVFMSAEEEVPGLRQRRWQRDSAGSGSTWLHSGITKT